MRTAEIFDLKFLPDCIPVAPKEVLWKRCGIASGTLSNGQLVLAELFQAQDLAYKRRFQRKLRFNSIDIPLYSNELNGTFNELMPSDFIAADAIQQNLILQVTLDSRSDL